MPPIRSYFVYAEERLVGETLTVNPRFASDLPREVAEHPGLKALGEAGYAYRVVMSEGEWVVDDLWDAEGRWVKVPLKISLAQRMGFKVPSFLGSFPHDNVEALMPRFQGMANRECHGIALKSDGEVTDILPEPPELLVEKLFGPDRVEPIMQAIAEFDPVLSGEPPQAEVEEKPKKKPRKKQ